MYNKIRKSLRGINLSKLDKKKSLIAIVVFSFVALVSFGGYKYLTTERASFNSKVSQQPVENIHLVTFAENANRAQIDNYLKDIGAELVNYNKELNTYEIKFNGQLDNKSGIIAETENDYYLGALTEEKKTEEVKSETYKIELPINDPLYNEQWALKNLDVEKFWTENADSKEKIVAVIDSGACLENEDMKGRYVGGYDFLENDNTPQDDFGHGCVVSGIIAANINNNNGIAGIAPNVKIMPLKVLDSKGKGTYSDLAEAIVYAVDHGAQSINMSLGGSQESKILEKAVKYASSKKVEMIAAAGNTGSETVLYPAKYKEVTAVGSVGKPNEKGEYKISDFSARGNDVDVWAPGEDIISVDGKKYNGTSLASAYVSGGNRNSFIQFALREGSNVVSKPQPREFTQEEIEAGRKRFKETFKGKINTGDEITAQLSKAETIDLIVNAAIDQGITDYHQLAYILATAEKESAFINQHEIGCGENGCSPYKVYGDPFTGMDAGRDRCQNVPATGLRYYGRGYVQLTWGCNYYNYNQIINVPGGEYNGIDIMNNPDLILANPDLAAWIMVDGMIYGKFTGASLSDYIDGNEVNYLNARAIINGDRDTLTYDPNDDPTLTIGNEVKNMAISYESLAMEKLGGSSGGGTNGVILVGPPCEFNIGWKGDPPGPDTYREYNTIADFNKYREHQDTADNKGRAVDFNIECKGTETGGYGLAAISGRTVFYNDNYGGTGQGAEVVDIYGEGPYEGIMVRALHFQKDSFTATVRDGRVERGEQIAIIGSTGDSEANHIHFEVWKNGGKLSYTSDFSTLPNQWEFSNSSNTSGGGSYVSTIPIPFDIDNDGVDNGVIFNPSKSLWQYTTNTTNKIVESKPFPVNGGDAGNASASDIPVPGDYDNDDDSVEFAVYRQTTGSVGPVVIIEHYNGENQKIIPYGNPGDIFVPGDFDDDGKTDMSIYRPSTGRWHISPSSGDEYEGNVLVMGPFVTNGVQEKLIPLVADFDQDGHDEFGLYRPANGDFKYVKRLSDKEVIHVGEIGNVETKNVYAFNSVSGKGVIAYQIDGPSNDPKLYMYVLDNGTTPRSIGNFAFGENGNIGVGMNHYPAVYQKPQGRIVVDTKALGQREDYVAYKVELSKNLIETPVNDQLINTKNVNVKIKSDEVNGKKIEVQLASNSSFTENLLKNEGTTTTTSFTIDDQVFKSKSEFFIRARLKSDVNLEGAWSDTIKVRKNQIKLIKPVDNSTYFNADQNIVFEWQKDVDFTYQNIVIDQYDTTGTNIVLARKILRLGTDTSFSLNLEDEGFARNSIIKWKVVGTRIEGFSVYTIESDSRQFRLSLDPAQDTVDRISKDGSKPVYRMVNTITGYHFYIIEESGVNTLLNLNQGWKIEGVEFWGYGVRDEGKPAGAVEIKRYVSPIPGSSAHVYLPANDPRLAQYPNWKEETYTEGGITYGKGFYAFTTQQAGTVPIYWFKARNGDDQFYTSSEEGKNFLLTDPTSRAYWTMDINNDGNENNDPPAFYAYPGTRCSLDGICPIYRLHNLTRQEHLYTNSMGEAMWLTKNFFDWRYEGISFYVNKNHVSNTVPLYRLRHDGLGTHFIIPTDAGKDAALAYAPDQNGKKWEVDGIIGYVYMDPNADPNIKKVTRYDRQDMVRHFHTTSDSDIDTIAAKWSTTFKENGAYQFYTFPNDYNVSYLGGNVKSTDSMVEAVFSPGSIYNLTNVDIRRIENPTNTPIAGNIYELNAYDDDTGEELNSFENNIDITFKITDTSYNINNLRLAYFDEYFKDWVQVQTTVDPLASKVSGQINHFTKFAVIEENYGIQIIDKPSIELKHGTNYQSKITAIDEEFKPINYSLVVKPSGMTIDNTGNITWQTTEANIGKYPIEIKISNGENFITYKYTLYVYRYDPALGDAYIMSLKDAGYGRSIIESDDNGFIIVGESSEGSTGGTDGFITKTDKFGIPEWQQLFGNANSDSFYDVVKTGDGNYLAVGSITPSSESDILLVKISPTGSKLWSKKLRLSSYNDTAYSVKLLQDGGYLIVGESKESSGTTNAWLVKVNSSGSIVWQKTFNAGGSNEVLYDAVELYDGSIVAVGFPSLITKFSSTGSLVWQKKLATSAYANSIVALEDGGFMVAGQKTVSANNSDIWLTRLDSNANEKWEEYIGDSLSEQEVSIEKTIDGNILLTATSRQDTGNNYDIYATKLDLNGTKIIQKKFGGTETDKHSPQSKFVAMKNGSFAFVGLTNSNNMDGMMLIKTDKDLNIPNCSFAKNRLMGSNGGGYITANSTISNTNGSATIADYTIAQKTGTHKSMYFCSGPNLNAPRFLSQPTLVTNLMNDYVYQLNGIDDDLDTLTYTIKKGPDGIFLNPQTNVITWHPGSEGNFEIEVELSDGYYSVLQNFTVKAINEHAVRYPNIIGSNGSDQINSIVIDSLGNRIVGGSYNGNVKMEGVTLNGFGSDDGYVGKYDNSTLVWAKRIGGTGIDRVDSVAVDSSDNVYVFGYIGSSATFDTITVSTAGAFVAKYDSNGNIIFAKNVATTTGNIRTDKIIVTSDSKVIFGGNYSTSLNLLGTAYTPTNAYDSYLGALDNQGNILWSKTLKGAGSFEFMNDLLADQTGNFYVATSYENNIQINSQTITGQGKSFLIAKFNSQGDLLWGKTEVCPIDTAARGLGIDANNNVYLVGTQRNSTSTCQLKEGITLFSNTGGGYFSIKFDSNGEFVSAKTLAKFGSVGNELTDMYVDAQGNKYITAYFISGGIVLDTSSIVNKGSVDGLIIKYDANDNYVWSKHIGTSSADNVNAIAGRGKRLYVVGEFFENFTIDTIPMVKIGNSFDAYVLIMENYQISPRITVGDLTDSTQDGKFTIKWTDKDEDTDAKISIYYDTDNQNYDGTLIVENISEDDETDQYEWNLANVPQGNYYLYFIIDDKINNPVKVYSNQIIVDLNDQPVFNTVPNQSINAGETFTNISLTNYASDPDAGDSLTFSYSGNTNITLSISNENVLTATYSSEWIGSETITLTVTDSHGLSENIEVIFEVKAVAPIVNNILKGIKSTTSVYSYSTGKFSNGDTLAAGHFTGNLTYGTFSENAGTYARGFVMRINTEGALVWVRTFSSTNSGAIQLNDAAVGTDDTVYITGAFQNSLNLHNDGLVLTAVFSQDVYTIKLDGNGNKLWAKSGGSTDADIARSLTLDAQNNAYVAGRYKNPITFGSFTSNDPLVINAFIVKYNPNGEEQYLKYFGNTSKDAFIEKLIVDSNGNIYASGWFNTNIDFNGNAYTGKGLNDGFLAKLDTSGNPVWIKTLGGTNQDYVQGLGTDSSGNVYISGTFVTDLDVEGTNHPATNTNNGFFIKYNSEGNVQSVDTLSSSAALNLDSLYIDSNNSVWVGGFIAGDIGFKGGDNIQTTSKKGIVMKLDPTGGYEKYLLGEGSSDINDILIKDNVLYAAGIYQSDISFAGMNETFAGSISSLILKISTESF